MSLIFSDVEVEARRCDVVVDDGLVQRILPLGTAPAGGGARLVDGGGAALIPGLWDHHVHLLASAAALESLRLDVGDGSEEFSQSLVDAAAALEPGRWLRVVGYHESIAGDIDRRDLDRIVPDAPVRVQHRSGARWILNSAGCESVGLNDADHGGIERDDRGAPTGRLTGADDWLRGRLGASAVPDLARLGDRLVECGVVGVTDAGPDSTTDSWTTIAAAGSTFAPHVWVMGGPELTDVAPPAPLRSGPVKLYLADHSLPDLETLCSWIDSAHRHGRAVAFHSVTRVSLALALAALDTAGSLDGDRIEHGSVVSSDAFDSLRRLGLCVVTQPGFIAERGDRYLSDVDADDVDHLYRCASLRDAGIRVGGSTDTPYSDPDPWVAIAAAVHRRTRSGLVVGEEERLNPRDALGLFLTPPDDPGGTVRRVTVGAAADLCLLDAPLGTALSDPGAHRVRATVIDGEIVYEA